MSRNYQYIVPKTPTPSSSWYIVSHSQSLKSSLYFLPSHHLIVQTPRPPISLQTLRTSLLSHLITYPTPSPTHTPCGRPPPASTQPHGHLTVKTHSSHPFHSSVPPAPAAAAASPYHPSPYSSAPSAGSCPSSYSVHLCSPGHPPFLGLDGS